MRVCHIASGDLWAGLETQVATAASYLVEQPEVGLSAVLLNEGRLARELRRLGVHVDIVDERLNGPLATLTRLTRLMRHQNVEVVHTHGYKESVLGSVAAKLAGVPHVIRTVHGLTEPLQGLARAKMRAYEVLDRVVLRCFADLVIAVSGRMADSLTRAGYRRTPMTRIYNGVDLQKVKATRTPDEVRRELGIDVDALLIGTAGRLTAIKGHQYLLRAARLILESQPDAKFLIVGGGPLKEELLATAAHYKVDAACLLPGPRDDVYDLMAAMDIFVLPSLDEGTPMSILEAMALGRPIVATAVGGIPEIISHRATALLVPPRSERALADACLELALDRERARTLGAEAMRVVEDRFSHRTNGQALVDEYRRVVGERAMSAQPGMLRRCFALTRGALRYGGRAFRHALETRRMNHIRRNPAAPMTALRAAKRLLIVCHGNIIRSPFASRLVAQTLGEQSRVAIASAGLEAEPGDLPHATAVLLASTRRVDLRDHRAAPVTPLAVATSDVILVMDIPQLIEIRKRFPQARAKTFLLTCFAPDTPLQIADPCGGDELVFEACFDHISRAVRPIAGVLAGAAVRP